MIPLVVFYADEPPHPVIKNNILAQWIKYKIKGNFSSKNNMQWLTLVLFCFDYNASIFIKINTAPSKKKSLTGFSW